ncbi:MAG: hypothetical protein JWR07_5297 [Nevskia sp.]|nr:hypothetical protein [Nevskia sp.]
MNEFEQQRMQDAHGGDEQPPIPGLTALKKDCAPQRDLWTGIDSRIRVQRVRQQRAPWLAAVGIAASLVLVLTASIGLQGLRGNHQSPLLHAPANLPVAASAVDNSLLPATNRMHPETRALVKANLKIVDSAENQLKRAIAADPESEYLKSLLTTTRQQKEQLHVVLADAR